MVVSTQRMTAEQFLALPPDPRMQLIHGEIVVNDPSRRHQRIALELARLLANWAVEHPGTGEAGIGGDIQLGRDDVFIPDVWWEAEAGSVPRGTAVVQKLPDLIIEVRSPSTWRHDIGRKKSAYERAGVSELWLVDTRSGTVLVFRRSSPEQEEFDVALEVGTGDTLSTPLIPDFRLHLGALFDR